MAAPPKEASGLRTIPWRLSYRTSSPLTDGKPVDILHEFYIPALRLSCRYDRVAGYFRSTSLAAASQGFSAFVENHGKVRLLVGADLDLADVRAVLNGLQERLTQALNAELAQEKEWPAAVRRGVELLAWLVAQGHLEVRVAFRVHSQSGEPLAVDSTEDGYVHEKWAVFQDPGGNRLLASGSLNESRTALVLNAENLDIHCDWKGADDFQRVDTAAKDFEALWTNRHPAIRVYALPEAVRQRLIRLAENVAIPAEIDGTKATVKTAPKLSSQEWLQFALLRDGPKLPGGRFVGMATAPISPWPHQAVVARRLIETWPYSYLLCDEVGLGKTIEAGLVFRSLYLSGLARRILIAPPASLTRQWQREMADKFLLSFGRTLGGASPCHEYLLPFEEKRRASSLYEPDLAIVSQGLLARRDRHPELARAAGFDIALVDEAHYARRQNPTQGTRVHPKYGQLYTTLRDKLRPKSRSLLLATATPMQLDPVEMSDLIQLTRRVGAFQYDPTLTQAYFDDLGKIVRGDRVKEHDWEFLRRAILAARDQDPLLWRFVESVVIDGRTRTAIRRWLEDRRIPSSRLDIQGIQKLIFAVSPLSRVMLRHTRSLLEVYREENQLQGQLAQREICPMPTIRFSPLEKAVYVQLERYCKGLAEKIAANQRGCGRGMIGFMLSFLRLRFASSLFALAETVRRRLAKVEKTLQAIDALSTVENDDLEELDLQDLLEEGDEDTEAVAAFLKNRTKEDLEWEREELGIMHHTMKDLSGYSSKMKALLGLLEDRRLPGTGRLRQTVIFTRFYDTLTDIVGRLRQADSGMMIGTYSGKGGQYFDPGVAQLVNVEREQIKQRFLRGEIDVLVCTDAAAEGLNLQTADWLINFDLPWNPMKVEQRIGRIDRIGQKHPRIYVWNLCYVDSAEQLVYDRLLQRLSTAGLIVGTQQMSLLPVTPEEFQELAEGHLSFDQLESQARKRADLARQRTRSMEIPPRDLYGIYQRLQDQHEKPVPVTMESIWQVLSASSYLWELGCRCLPDAEKMTLILHNLPGIPDGTALTASRQTFDFGLEALQERPHFSSYGDPFFDALLQHLEEGEPPPCLQKILVKDSAGCGEMVAYAAAVRSAEGLPCVMLIKSLDDLEGVALDEGRELTENDIAPLRKTVQQIADDEFAEIAAVEKIEKINEKAGQSQELLNLIVIAATLRARQPIGEELFWKEISRLEETTKDHQALYIPKIPVEPTRYLEGLLFDVTLPQVGTDGHMLAPPALIKSSIEAACRLTDSLKINRGEMTTERFLARAEREIKKGFS